MYPFSDSSSSDSEDGIRYKTESTRKFEHGIVPKSSEPERHSDKRRSQECKKSRKSRDRSTSREKQSKSLTNQRDKRKRYTSSDSEDSKSSSSRRSKKDLTQDKTEEFCGPKLPTRLVGSGDKKDIRNRTCGPSLSPNLINEAASHTANKNNASSKVICGPEIPPNLKLAKSSSDDSIKSNDLIYGPQVNAPQPPPINQNQVSGPQLPPHLLNRLSPEEDEKHIGPSLPLHLRQELAKNSDQAISKEELVEKDDQILSDDDDDDTYGPLPPEMVGNSEAHRALEERALQMKLEALNPKNDDRTVREEWMIELPGVQAKNLGLGPRQFRAKAGPDLSDRSSWTDTPNSKKIKGEKKIDIKKEAEVLEILKRDEKQEEMSRKHKKKEKSLLEQHQKKQKKEEKLKPQERVPFNRENDLKVNRFDEAQKKAIFKKAQLLDDRFSKGQSKFL